MEETVVLIKSCISSKQGGVLVDELNYEFRNLVGENIPYRKLGFSNLRALLRTIDGLETQITNFGEEVLTLNDSKVSHLDKLIRNQKVDYSKAKDKYYKQLNDGNLRFNINERREKNRLLYNTNRANRRERDFAHYRNSNLFQTNGVYKSNSLRKKKNHRPIIIETNNKFNKYDNMFEPIANGRQLLGDDFLLQLATRNLHLPIWRYKDTSALHCGLCISGQTIRDCIRALRNIKTISSRVVILLGSVDVYNNATSDEMIKDMTELLQVLQTKFYLSNSAITICTLPPLANLGIYSYHNKNIAFFSFNNWIRSLSDDPSKREPSFVNYPVIDLFEKFCYDETNATNYNWFQNEPCTVSGSKHFYVLWNNMGRNRAMNLICEEEDVKHSRSLSSWSNPMD